MSLADNPDVRNHWATIFFSSFLFFHAGFFSHELA